MKLDHADNKPQVMSIFHGYWTEIYWKTSDNAGNDTRMMQASLYVNFYMF